MTEPHKYHTIFISDTHLIANGCEADLLADFLTNVRCDKLVLVGDIIDGWRAKSSFFKLFGLKKNQYGLFFDVHQVRAFKKLLSKTTKCQVEYIIGNHDDFLLDFVDTIKNFGNLTLHEEYLHIGVDGKKYLVIHGHQFDGIIVYHEWLAFLADYSYGFLLWISKIIQWCRKKIGRKGYWSLSYVIKHKVKMSLELIYNFKQSLCNYCIERDFDGVICGHTHFSSDEIVDNIRYLNCGDWVDSCTAVVEEEDGTLKIIKWRI